VCILIPYRFGPESAAWFAGADGGRRRSAVRGAHGQRYYDWCRIAIPCDVSGRSQWALARQSPTDGQIAYSNTTGQRGGEPGTGELIPLTLPEIRRLLAKITMVVATVAFVVHRSLWRRRRQKRARVGHYKARGLPEPP